MAPSATPLHLYDFNGTLADSMGGPSLVSDGGTVGASRYTFGAGQGLSLTDGLASTTTYSILIVGEYDSLENDFKKIIDFQNRTSDDGLYAVINNVDLIPGDAGTGTIEANTDFQLLLARDGATGETRLYLNGELQQVYIDNASLAAVPGQNILYFFEDDARTAGSEAAPGSVDRIAIYNTAITPADLIAQNTPPVVSADQATVTVDEGQNAANTGVWSDFDSDPVTLTASAGAITQNPNGTWSWSFAASDGPDETQTVTITATDSQGGVSSTTFDLVVNNVAPSVTSDAATVTVDEGQTATNTGAWGDPGADTVSLTASAGAVVKNSDGTWTWSFASNGTDQSRSVIVTATDSDGAVSTTSFSLVVNNVAPSVNSDAASVTVDEGQNATNSGTWSDPGGDTVTLSASVGVVVKNANGTWSWSFAASDGPDQSQTVTITATDSDGAVSTTTFDLVVNNVAPSVSSGAANVVVNEGQTAANSGAWGDVGSDEVTLTASVGTVVKNNDGTWSWSYAGASQSQTVTITATDSDGAVSTTSFTLVVNNVAPTITSLVSSNGSSANISANGNVTISGAFSDPGSLDTHTVTINWGDGSAPQVCSANDVSKTFSASHHYASGGIYSISVVVTDNDGGVSAASTAKAYVTGFQLVNGTLYIVGTNGDDRIAFELRQKGALLRVTATFPGAPKRQSTFSCPTASVNQIVIVTGTGNDQVQVPAGFPIDIVYQDTVVAASTSTVKGHVTGHLQKPKKH